MKIGFIADIHEDITMLRSAIDTLNAAQCDQIVCLGDIIGFSTHSQRHHGREDADACVALVRTQCSVAVAGNHDLYGARRIPEHKAGFPYPANWYDLSRKKRESRGDGKLWTYDDHDIPAQLSNTSLEFLLSLREYAVLEADGIRLFISHFAYPDLSGSLIRSLGVIRNLEKHFSFMHEWNCQIGFSGHGHPEGAVRSYGGELETLSFGLHTLPHRRQWLVCPCVTKTERSSGVLTFDIPSFQLELLSLHAPMNNR